MAILRAYSGIQNFNLSAVYGQVLKATSTEIVISAQGVYAQYLGSFSYDIYNNVYGTLTGFKQGDRELWVEVSGFAINASYVQKALNNGDVNDVIAEILSGNDKVYGSNYGDRLTGYSGNDVLNGGGGNDALWGESGQDKVFGGKGGDFLSGGGGNDVLSGGGGRDKVFGGKGDDILGGDNGNDVLRGGKGHDSFIFDKKDGKDIVKDYNDNFDTIGFYGAGRVGIRQVGDDVRLKYGDTVIFLEDTDRSEISQDDFYFI